MTQIRKDESIQNCKIHKCRKILNNLFSIHAKLPNMTEIRNEENMQNHIIL